MEILLVEDEAAIRFAIREFLTARGFAVRECGSVSAALEQFLDSPPDAVVLDYRLPDGNALDLLPQLFEAHPDVPVAVLTAHGSIDLAVAAVKAGAEQFLTKPVELPALEIVLKRMLDNRQRRRREAAAARRGLNRALDPFAGTSDAIRALADDAERLLETDRPILIRGETGTGKGVLAHWLHRHGTRADEPFVDINCSGLSRELLETELFGHEKGSFTSAEKDKAGLFEVADRGTVFLDEIGDVDLQVQPKLLKVLEDKRFRRVGGVRERQVDLRFVSATHRNLPEMAVAGEFRSDLYYRVSTMPLDVPPLRHRPADVPVLARRVLAAIVSEMGRGPEDLSAAAEAALCAHPWPGNVRELRNVLERGTLLAKGQAIEACDLRFDLVATAPAAQDSGSVTLEDAERRHVQIALEAEGGHVARTAERLGIPRSSLYEKLRRFGLR